MEELKDYLNDEYILKDRIYTSIKDIIKCCICLNIIIEPMMCMRCNNNFCKKCIEQWTNIKKECPFRCQNTNYKKSLVISKLLSKLKFNCKKCQKIVNYDNMEQHLYTNCDTKKCYNIIYNIEKFLSTNAIFEKIENRNDINYESKFIFKSK